MMIHAEPLRFDPRRDDAMHMVAAPQYWTAQMVRELPDDGMRYECVYGELLVSSSPREIHQRVLGRLYLAVARYLETEREGVAYFSPADISWRKDTLVQPDLFVVPRAEAREGWPAMRTLWLAIEVLSPSTSRHDRFTKRVLYQREGVASYWIVDPKARLVEIWTPSDTEPIVVRERATWSPVGASEPLVIPLSELFAPV